MLGIVILNYKAYVETLQCVSNIFSISIDEPYNIYIVDNDSPNESFDIFSREYCKNPKVKLIQSGRNGGFSYGNNVGFQAAIADGCDKILCTNNDVKFENDAISILCKDLDEHAECAVIGPMVYCFDGSIQNGNKGILTAKRFIMRRKPFSFFDWFGIEKKYTYSNYQYNEPIYVEGMVSGCCFLLRSTAIREVGFLDDNVFLYHEENILGAKLRVAGYKVRLNPAAKIIHYGGKSTGGNSAFLRFHSFYSALYYFWSYSNVSTFTFNILCMVVKTMFLFRSIGNREYKAYHRKLKKEIGDLKKKPRRMED